MDFEYPLDSDRDQVSFVTNKMISRDVSMVATKNDEDDDEPYESNDNILLGSVMRTDSDNILRNMENGPLASHNYSMIDEALEEEEKIAYENVGPLDDEDEEFKNA
jgi:hypothetical protein